MSLYLKIFALVLIPFAVLFGASMWAIQGVINSYEQSLTAKYQIRARAVEHRFWDLFRDMDTAEAVLAQSNEIRRAIETADNEELFDLSRHFVGNIDDIIFVRADGLVVARAPGEFRVGDNYIGRDYFEGALKNGAWQGIGTVDGRVSFIRARAVSQYNDLPVGVVCVAVNITPQLLRSLVDGADVILRFRHDGYTTANSVDGQDIAMVRELAVFPGRDSKEEAYFNILFPEDFDYHHLVGLKNLIYLGSAGGAAVSFLLLLYLLSSHLKPYSMIVDRILDHANQKSDTRELYDWLVALNKGSRQNIKKTSGALIQMLDVIQDNYQRIEDYNEELTTTVAELERTLAELRTLSGLLPICANCKKIRDDQGYWQQIEEYISEHSAATFSHGICPECLQVLYPEYAKDKK